VKPGVWLENRPINAHVERAEAPFEITVGAVEANFQLFDKGRASGY
jgi:hypothetical protein